MKLEMYSYDSENSTLSDPKCHRVPEREFVELSPIWKYEGNIFKTSYHDYFECHGQIVATRHIEEAKIVCFCNMMYTFGIADILLAFSGIILNSIVLKIFCRKMHTNRKIASVILAHQASVDLLNCIFLLPKGLDAIIWKFVKFPKLSIFLGTRSLTFFLFMVSASSSIFTFAAVAVERWTSITKPLWHRANMKIGWVKRAIRVIWSASIIIAVVTAALQRFGSYLIYRYHMFIMLTLISFAMLAITVIFSLSYVNGRKNISGKSGMTISARSIRRQLRFTVLFIIMYVTFLLAFLPMLIVGILWMKFNSEMANAFTVILFAITSSVNPVMTLTLKSDFKEKRNSAKLAMKLSVASTKSTESSL